MVVIFSDLSIKYFILLKILSLFKLRIYYIRIKLGTSLPEIRKLEKINVFPVPIEKIGQIKGSYRPEFELDKDRLRYKYAKNILPAAVVKKMTYLFNNITDIEKKINIILLTKYSGTYSFDSCVVNIFSEYIKKERLLYIETRISGMLQKNFNANVKRIILPLDILYLIFSIPVKFIETLIKTKDFYNIKKRNVDKKNCLDYESEKIAYVVHKGGTGSDLLFQGSPYYSINDRSKFNKYNILHFDYSSYKPSDEKMKWVNLEDSYSTKKLFIKLILNIFRFQIFHPVKIFGLIAIVDVYLKYSCYLKQLKKYKNLTHVIIDYEILCPKSLLLAFESLGVKTIATQERPFLTFNNVHGTFLDFYLTASSQMSERILESPSYLVKNCFAVGMYRTDYFYKYKNIDVFRSLTKLPQSGSKLITFFGFHTTETMEESSVDPMLNWTAHKEFLKDAITVANKFNKSFVVLRYKNVSWMNNQFFSDEIKEIESLKNIEISQDYTVPYFSYALCAASTLVVAKHSSIADECLAVNKNIIIHDYTHNSIGYFLNTYDYESVKLFALNQRQLIGSISKFLDDPTVEVEYKYSGLYENYSDGNVISRIQNFLEKTVQ